MFFLIWLILTLIGPCWILITRQVDFKADYRTANRASAGLAPRPEVEKGAVIQAYAARAFNWRGVIASHCWIAIKAKNAETYTVYQVVGWRQYWNLPALTVDHDIPDRYWYNAKPQLILDIRGAKAESLIPKIEEAARTFPYPNQYTLWPGPNSNTFPAYVGRLVPELRLALPSDAIGKDFLGEGRFFARAPSGTGWQFSLYGALGVLVAAKEGIEINLLGLVYGIRFWPLAVLLPGLGNPR